MLSYIHRSDDHTAANASRKDSKFSQIVRNLKSHKTAKTNFIYQGYAQDIPGGFRSPRRARFRAGLLQELGRARPNPPGFFVVIPPAMATYEKVEDVKASPQYGNSGPPGWGFTLWNDSLDDEPHRPLLERFAERYPECALRLPEHYSGEDCVEGSMTWQSNFIWVWYEHLLTHLWLWSADRDTAQSLRAALLPFAQDA